MSFTAISPDLPAGIEETIKKLQKTFILAKI
jgi:hypothetical protein